MDFVRGNFFACSAAFLLAFVFIWLPTYPMMIDMPQHVAQLEVMKELITSSNAYLAEYLEINWLTTYLVGYFVALPFAWIVPSLLAIKIALSLAFLTFVFYSRRLFIVFEADQRFLILVWMSFFGLSWIFGLYSFLISIPIGLAYICFCLDYHEKSKGIFAILVSACLLFFSHGLAFPFFVSMAFMLCLTRSGLRLQKESVFIAGCSVLFAVFWVCYYFYTKTTSETLSSASDVLYGEYLKRFVLIFYSPYGTTDTLWLPVISLFALTSPFFVGLMPSRKAYKYIPLAWVLMIWFAAPMTAEATTLLFNRWSIILALAYFLVFEKSEAATTSWYSFGLIGVLLAFSVNQAYRACLFNKEVDGFEGAISSIEPNRKLASVMIDSTSDGAGMRMIYSHFGMYYQYSRHGLVDPSFSISVAPPVHYKSTIKPSFNESYVWEEVKTSNLRKIDFCEYDYLLFRSRKPIDISAYESSRCGFARKYMNNTWWVFAKGH